MSGNAAVSTRPRRGAATEANKKIAAQAKKGATEALENGEVSRGTQGPV